MTFGKCHHSLSLPRKILLSWAYCSESFFFVKLNIESHSIAVHMKPNFNLKLFLKQPVSVNMVKMMLSKPSFQLTLIHCC